MSESSKMGLFGSKDENPETTDENKEAVKPNETSQEHYVPYNIDSDSETYDTEALSIMDINDIIGIQAESASDSTLESEFAALSEVITNIKSDELTSEIGGALDAKKSRIGRSDRKRDIGSTKDKGSEKDTPKEDIFSATDDNKSPHSADMAGINKSLQLIGEAYISEDSQETDADEIPGTSVPKSVDIHKSFKTSKNEGAKDATKNSTEIIASAGKQIAQKQTIADECSAERKEGAASVKSLETAIKPVEEDLKSMRIEKSADSTDSSSTHVSTKQSEEENKTENMDVDSALTRDVAESALVEKTSCNKPEESEAIEKVAKVSKIDLAAVDTENLTVEPVVEAEEPMEVDQPVEEISDRAETEKADPVATEEVFEYKPGPSDPGVAGEAAIVSETSNQPEESKKSIDEILDHTKTSSEPKICEIKATEIVEEELKRPSNSSKDEEIAAEKLEMETDDSQIKESLAEKIEANSPVPKVVESVVETVEQKSKIVEVKQETSFESVQQVGAIERHDTMPVKYVEAVDEEPMEVDDNAVYHKSDSDKKGVNAPNLSDNSVDIVEPLAGIAVPLKPSASDEPVDSATDSSVNSSENITESAKNKTIPTSSVLSKNSAEVGESTSNITLKECAKDETSVPSELSENSSKIIESVPVVTSKESANDKRVVSEFEASGESSMIAEAMETEDITLKGSSKKELAVSTSTVSEKTSEVVDTVPDIIQRESSIVATEETALEDEKMEVDAGAKKKKQEDQESDICRLDGASHEPEESSMLTVQKVSAVEEKPTIEKAGDLNKVEDSENAEKTVEDAYGILRVSVAGESSEIEATKSIDETDEARQESKESENVPLPAIQKANSSAKKIQDIVTAEKRDNAMAEVAEDEKEVKSASKEEEKEISSGRPESSTEKSPGVEVTKIHDEPLVAEDKKNSIKPEVNEAKSFISTEIAESSTDQIHGIEATKTSDDAIEEDVEKVNKKTQPKGKEDETILLVSIEKPESLAGSSETKTRKATAAETGKSVGDESDEAVAITKEEQKESLVSIKELEPTTISSGIEIAEASNTIIKGVEDEKEETKAGSKESPMLRDNSNKTIREIKSTEIVDKTMVEDVKEESKSESKAPEKEPPIFAEATARVPQNPETHNSQKDAEKAASTTFKKEVVSRFVLSKPENAQQETSRSDLSSSSINPDDVEGEEDPVEEEMNLSLDPDITECQESVNREDAGEEAQRIGELSLEEMPIDAEEMEDQVDLNLSLDPEENVDGSPNVRYEPLDKLAVEDSVGESSMTSATDKPEQSDERLEKPTEDDDDNSKDILSTMVREPEMFHDEQSQNTQEMMDSILETDSSNFNKILDDEEGVGAALACTNDLPLEEAEINELVDKLPSESEELLNTALDDPMSSQNIDSLEGLLDLDLMQEGDESALKSVDPIVAKVMNEAQEEIEIKGVDVSLLSKETDQGGSVDRDEYVSGAGENFANADIFPKVVEEKAKEIAAPVKSLLVKSALKETLDSAMPLQLATAVPALADNDIDAAFDLSSVEPNPLEADQSTSEDSKFDLAENLLREITVDEERKMELAEKLLLVTTTVEKDNKIDLPGDLLLQTAVQKQSTVNLPSEVLLAAAVEAERGRDTSLEMVVREVLTAAAEIEGLPPNSEISELESAVKFLQESEEQGIDSPLVLTPKMVDSVVDEIARDDDVGIFVTNENICEDPSALVAELGSIIPDPIAISEAEIISEAAKLENEKKTKVLASEEAKLQSPISARVEGRKKDTESTPPLPVAPEASATVVPHPETPKTHKEIRETVAMSLSPEKVEQVPLLKKSAPIPKISILEERLKEPPKIEIPSVGEVSRNCEMPTTPKTSLLIQRDAKFGSFQRMLESPKTSDKTEHKIVDTSRKDGDKPDFENVGSPRIILKIPKSAFADCGEPRSPKSPKIRSATNSPNPEDSPGQKLGKIKLKLSKGGHPSIISNENVEEVCGQWHTEGTSSLSPLGMKIKFSKTGDASIVHAEKHETMEEATKETPKHKFEEAKRTESPIGMKIKFSKTGDASIVQQDSKESTSKHKDKLDIMQGSPKRNESPIGMKIKFSKSGDASIIQPEKSESSEDHREGSSKGKDKLDVSLDVPRRTESPLGMKFKLSKTGDASIVASEIAEDSPQETKRTGSPLGMKIKRSKTRGSASIVPAESSEDVKERLEASEVPRITESPLGMKIKFSKSGDASIIHSDETKDSTKHKERAEASQESVQASEAPIAVKMKVTKSRDVSILQTEVSEEAESVPGAQKRTESSIGMKFKLSKTGDASIVHSELQEHVEDLRSKEKAENPQETPRKPDAAIGMKIKFSKTGDASIIQSQLSKKSEEPSEIENERQRSGESALPMKIKMQRSGEASIVESEKKDKSTRRKETDSPLEMKIKLSKTGHPTIVACDNYGESSQRAKDIAESHKHKESTSSKEIPGMKMLKSMHSGMHGKRSELTIEPVQLQSRKSDGGSESSPKRKDVMISPVESKKAKLEAKLSQMLPELTIQPIIPRDQKQIMFDAKASSISRQQMNVISQEISITQVRPNKAMDLSMTDKLKSMLVKNATTSANADCEIIEHRPELIIVNENSNSSQDVMIIEEVPALRGPEPKVPKKRGRPRRNPAALVLTKPMQQAIMPTDAAIPRDPLALDDVTQLAPQMVSQIATQMVPHSLPPKENERPKRTCSRQKSYAPPRRGRRRGGGRGKRKMEMAHMELSKKPRIDQDLDMVEQSTTALITIDESASQPEISHSTSELYKALRQPPMDHKMANAIARVEAEQAVNDADSLAKSSRESLMDSRIMSHLDGVIESSMNKPAEPTAFDTERKMSLESLCSSEGQSSAHLVSDQMEKSEMMSVDDKIIDKGADESKDNKDTASAQDHQNWLTPSSKKLLEGRNEGNISSIQAIDEETRMSAESSSRSQTPARNMSLQAPETIVNEESQGSVLSTATTESEKVKVKSRRMEINFDPDEGPFTVDKVAEYEWPPDPTRKGETFMIQEQISHYLGVKSFKRKYPDLKRRMVDMEERNYLRENALVSEAMCDMGLTAVSSSEVLDIMCNDFPDQYEEYRKYIREKQMKEHSKKQKELTAAANAEKNRIDLAEMAVQSALSWNVGLNKARRESRKCSLDLQTFTIHVPKKQQKVEEESRQSHYPVTLIPGQYTDYYREYTPAELRYYPLNTVLYGPMKPNERKLDSQSEGSQSDSDSDSSSDDSSSSSSDGTQDTEESQSTMDEVDVELSRQKEDIKSIKCKMCLKHLNKFSRTEVLIQCGTCNGYVHPSCIDLTLDMVPHIQAYAWQCTDCKTCAQCHDPADEDKMLFCDMCDRGYHIYCVGLRRVPQGRWHCQECAVCASCGCREAGGANSDRNSVAQWQHEYKKGDKNTRVYVSTLCVPCSKLWRKGRYCPHCSRCHTVPRLDLEANLVHCSACDKYLHLGCVETKDLTIDRKNYLCDFCQPSRQQMVKPLVSKVFKT